MENEYLPLLSLHYEVGLPSEESILVNQLTLESTKLKNEGKIEQAIVKLDEAIKINNQIKNYWNYELDLKKVAYMEASGKYEEALIVLNDMFDYPVPEELGNPPYGHFYKIYKRMRIISKKHDKDKMYYAATLSVIMQGFLAYETDKEIKKGKREFPHYKKYPDMEFQLTQKQKDDFKGYKSLVSLCKDIFSRIDTFDFNRFEMENLVKKCIVTYKKP